MHIVHTFSFFVLFSTNAILRRMKSFHIK